ncbi:MAG: type IV secretory system conjugative DNA transfer family protein [Oscillospiraceae bacterium]
MWIEIGIIFFVLILVFMVYATYVYLDYNATQAVAEQSFETVIAAINQLFKPLSAPFSVGLLKTAVIYQVTKLWWVYILLALCAWLAATSKNPNDYRGTEHGSATWADKYDEKEFADTTGIPIGNGFYASISGGTKKKPFYKPHNLNEIVIGGSGAGKSFRKIKPDIMQLFGSYVITDPKGELYRDMAKILTENGYKIRVLNLININLSNSYNPFFYMTEEQDVLSVADLFMKNTAGEGEKEDFWSGSAQDLLVSIMLYLWKSTSELKSFGRVIRLVNSISYTDSKIDELCELARCMKKHSIENPNDAATVNWKSILSTPQETMGSIAKTLSTRLRLWAVEDVDELTWEDEMDFDNIGVEKTAVFLIIPAARQTYKAVANIFYSQLFERLMYVANTKYNGRLPLLVSCELDEFANIGKIPNFNETLAVVRSHNIRLCIVLQGLSQLKALYEKTWESIIGNCSLFTYLGTNDGDTKEYVVKRLGKTTVRIDARSYNRGNNGGGSDSETYVARDLLTVDEIALAMRPKGSSKKFGGKCISFIDEYRPFFIDKFDTLNHHLIGSCGSSFPKDFANNTNIAVTYEALKSSRKQKHTEAQEEHFVQAEIERQASEAETLEKEADEQANLANQFLNATDFEKNINEEINPILNNFEEEIF